MSHIVRSLARAQLARSLRLVLIVTAAVAPAIVFAAEATDAAPPHYPDATHVANGCHVSTLTYLARFAAEFPAETGRPIIVQMRNAGDVVKPHTMALVTWHGDWWIRDEYFGVFPLEARVAGEPDTARLTARAARLYERHAQLALRRGAARPPEVPAQLSPADRRRAVAAAASELPFPHTVFWVEDGAREIPLVFFRPAPGQVAVYDPAHGTGVGECALRDDAKVVALIAARLGYRAERVRAEALPAGTLVANAAAPATVALAR